jgi:hypothetical protein
MNHLQERADSFLVPSGIENSELFWFIVDQTRSVAGSFPPQLILANPKTLDFNRYYDQAVRAYIHGLYGASLIIFWTFFEIALNNILFAHDRYRKLKNFEKTIDEAYAKEFISQDDKENLQKIRKLRNDFAHELKEIIPESALDCVIQMKNIFENLFKDENNQ